VKRPRSGSGCQAANDSSVAIPPHVGRPAGPTRVAYHVHTRFSYDCQSPLEEILERALSAGIGSLCVTDHDTIQGAQALMRIAPRNVEIVVGCEFTLEDGSHIVGLNLKDMIPAKGVVDLLSAIKRQGGLVVLPHPFRRSSGIFRSEMRRSKEFVREVLSFADMIECFNGRDSYEHNQRSYDLSLERGLPTVAGSDAHDPAQIGSVFVEYRERDWVHGVSPRRVFAVAQRAGVENPLKRRVMEFYHRHKRSLPPVVDVAYRTFRKPLGDRRRRATPPPELLYEFGRTAILRKRAT
jgi:predicted metal-dependent phosphoesterase TrpH